MLNSEKEEIYLDGKVQQHQQPLLFFGITGSIQKE